MSAEEDEEASLVHMVTAPYRSRANDEMTLVGMVYGAGLVLVLLPLLPFIVILWALSSIRESRTPDAGH